MNLLNISHMMSYGIMRSLGRLVFGRLLCICPILTLCTLGSRSSILRILSQSLNIMGPLECRHWQSWNRNPSNIVSNHHWYWIWSSSVQSTIFYLVHIYYYLAQMKDSNLCILQLFDPSSYKEDQHSHICYWPQNMTHMNTLSIFQLSTKHNWDLILNLWDQFHML